MRGYDVICSMHAPSNASIYNLTHSTHCFKLHKLYGWRGVAPNLLSKRPRRANPSLDLLPVGQQRENRRRACCLHTQEVIRRGGDERGMLIEGCGQ